MKEFKHARLHSSLRLQILLFLNVYLVPVWLISSMHFLWCQMYNGSPIEKTLTIFATAIASPVELVRLYFGYSGNLRELIPDFGGFWILSTFVSLPMHIYMLFAEYSASQTLLPTHQFLLIHLIIQAIALSLLIFEVFTAFFVIRHLSEMRVKQFHLNHLLKNTYKSTSTSAALSDVQDIKTLPSTS